MPPQPTIAVIGGGFSGSAVAVNLLRRNRPVRVVLVNRYGPIGRGVAYGTRLEAHVLNVPAGGMSALADDAAHFLRWARERDPAVGAGTFVSRRLYGQYLAQTLEEAERGGAAQGAVLDRVVGEVRDLAIPGEDSAARLSFADGSKRDADHVVLALGNYSPNDPPVESGADFYRSARYVRDPWVRGALDTIREGESVLLLGTGLTMLDIALDLSERGIAIPLRAVSRHGLLPRAHLAARAAAPPPAPPAGLDAPRLTIARLLRATRAHARAQSNWRDTIGALRAITPALWSALPDAERARFLRHVRPFWDVHRHRAAPVTASAIERLLGEGALQVRAGRVAAYRETASDVEVTLRPRGRSAAGAETERVVVDRVVNCTGPSSDVARVGDLLLDALLAGGRIAPDPLRLGLRVADDLAVLDAEGRPSPAVSLVGPLLKARFWEATAVPELRVHAARIAARLLP